MDTTARRPETPDRWARALDRAIANGIEPLQIAGSGEWVVTSATKLNVVYRTDGIYCECEAGVAGDAVCMHRAVIRQILGLFDQPQPMSATVECAACHGRGWNYYEIDGGRSFPGKEPCRRCHGAGRMPVLVRVVPAALTPMAAD